MNLDEDLIWETILESAKLRFDYDHYDSHFGSDESYLSQNLILEIIIGLAAQKNELVLALEISHELCILEKW